MLNENQKSFMLVPIFLGAAALAVLVAAWYYGNTIPGGDYIFANWNTILIFGIGMVAVPSLVLWSLRAFKGLIFIIVGGGILYLFGQAASGNPDAKFLSGSLIFAAFLGVIGFGLELHKRAQLENPNYRSLVALVFTSFMLPIGVAAGAGLGWAIFVFCLEWGLYIGAVFLFRKAKENVSNTFSRKK